MGNKCTSGMLMVSQKIFDKLENCGSEVLLAGQMISGALGGIAAAVGRLGTISF
jgi:hypothetical protein